MSNKYHYLLKYIIIGNSSVGKSNLLLRYCNNKFSDDYQATIGVEFGAKNIEYNNKTYRIQIWDTAGQESFRSITRAYYKNCVCAIIVYDITNRDSFESIKDWVKDIKDSSPKTVLISLVGNKIDLEKMRVISFEEGKEYAQKNNFIFMETSAKTGVGVKEIFYNSVNIISKKIDEDYYNLDYENCGIKKGNLDNNSPLKKHKLNIHEVRIKLHEKKEDCCK